MLRRFNGCGLGSPALVLLLALSGWCGCMSAKPSVHRAEAYRPDIPAEDRDAILTAESGGSSVTDASPATALRRLKRGDRVVISKRSIPKPEDINDVIDDEGEVNLSLVGPVRLAGLTTSEAEKLIEKLYIDGRYYSRISVIVVAQADEYFMRGEVRGPGKYGLMGDITLTMAISAAGGYTEFANPRRITIYRGEEVLKFNADRIEARLQEDPIIHPNDNIVVGRRWFL